MSDGNKSNRNGNTQGHYMAPVAVCCRFIGNIVAVCCRVLPVWREPPRQRSANHRGVGGLVFLASGPLQPPQPPRADFLAC